MLETLIFGIALKYLLVWSGTGILTFLCVIFSDWFEGSDTSVGEILGATFVGAIIGFVAVVFAFPYIFKAIRILFGPFNFQIQGRKRK